MKIGILSMQRVANFGSVLQAYGLKKLLESFEGVECAYIDIEEREEDKQLLSNSYDYSIENGKKSISQKIDRYVFNRFTNYKKYKKQIDLIKAFQTECLGLDNSTLKEYDLCVIGSDEVFNCLQPSSWGYTSQLFGNVKGIDKIATYAASCGSTRKDDLPDEVLSSIRRSMENISFISVRDKNTFDFVNSITGIKPTILLDPVFITDFEKEISEIGRDKCVTNDKYCIIYSYYNRIHDLSEIKEIKDLCNRKNMRIMSVFAPQFWVQDYKLFSPFELLAFFKNAEFVLTDTFHGTIFAAKYAHRFGVIVRNSNHNKLDDLITRIGINDHRVYNLADLEKIYEIYDDKATIHLIETQEYIRSLDYFRRVIIAD